MAKGNVATKKASILVVDNDPRYVELVRVNMYASGHRVSTATEVATAIKLAKTQSPDLIILDVMMPGLDAYEVCRRIREFSLVPIIMLTARGEQLNKVKGLRLNAYDYVSKPFGVNELIARVEAVLRRANAPMREERQPVEFKSGDLLVDFAHPRALVRGEDANLTAIEFKLLRHLVANAGFTVSQDDLLSEVWGTGYHADREVVSVCISRLRRKIEDDPRHPKYIRTRRGIGYIFFAEQT